METRLVRCQNCGAELDVMTSQCPYCAPAADALKPEAPSVPAGDQTPGPPPPAPLEERDKSHGLSLFEAEEALARGAADKALVLASKAVKERPDSLTARALLDRARRELLRGRRREKLEARLKEAQGLVERGETAAAERIVSSALKLIPDHALALDLFGRLKERRLKAGSAEAEAERELMALARTQARQALEAARTALAAGWARKAFLALRRGLLLVPDDPDLLALLRKVQQAVGGLDAERSRRHALVRQVRAGLDLLAQGQIDASLRILRAALREDPDNTRAQAAVQEVRRAWLATQLAPSSQRVERPAPQASALVAPPRPAPAAVAAPHRPEPPPMPVRPAPGPRPQPVSSPARPAAVPPAPGRPALAPTPSRVAPAASRPAIPPEILLPRRRRKATPLGLSLGAGVLVVVVVIALAGRTAVAPPAPAPLAVQAAAAAPGATRPAPPAPRPPGPLDGVDADLRKAIESALAAYARALERGDAALLEKARPDMGPAQREARLAPFVGALNAATDLRVLDIDAHGDRARVSILATDVIVGGRGGARAPQEETLHFGRRGGGWTLRGGEGR